jgi:hypothetical protein
MAADMCGARRGDLVCDRAPHADGDHRGYLEAVDEVLFWPSVDALNLEELEALVALVVWELNGPKHTHPNDRSCRPALKTARRKLANLIERARA